MGFVVFVSIMLILHFLCLIFVHCTMFVLCYAYHVDDKMPLRCFCVSLWMPLNTKVVGIIMFL